VMAPANGLWLIDATRPHDGAAAAPCAGSAPGAGATDGSEQASPPS